MDSTREHDRHYSIEKTAEMMRNEYPEAADIIQNNTYMDDIIESKDNITMARELSQDIEKAIVKGGFQVKEWIFSGDISKQEEQSWYRNDIHQQKRYLGSNGVHVKISYVLKSRSNSHRNER